MLQLIKGLCGKLIRVAAVSKEEPAAARKKAERLPLCQVSLHIKDPPGA